MNFRTLNESFEKKFKHIVDYKNELIEKLENCLNNLNEANISDADKHDSDLIRSMIDKLQNRANAKFSPEEIAVMDKYGIERNNNNRKLYVDGRELNRGIDKTQHHYIYGDPTSNNGNPSKINYADRARKLPKRKDNQIFTGPWTLDNDQINKHGYSGTRFDSLQDAERYSQDIAIRDKIRAMKDNLRDREFYQNEIDNADKNLKQALDKAKQQFDAAVDQANKEYEHTIKYTTKYRDEIQAKIDNLLKQGIPDKL